MLAPLPCTSSPLQTGRPAAAAGAGASPDPADSPGAHLRPSTTEQSGGWARPGLVLKQGTETPSKLLTVPAPSRDCRRIGTVRVNQEVRQMVGA